MKNHKTSKKEIIKKSWDIFDRNSFFSLSMREIANHLNIQKSLLYYYFSSKSELFREVILENIENIYTQFDIIFNSRGSSTQKIGKLAKLYLDKIQSKSILKLRSVEENKIDDSILSALDNIEIKITNYFVETFQKGIKKGEFKNTDPKNLSLALLGYLDKINIRKIKPTSDWLDFIFK